MGRDNVELGHHGHHHHHDEAGRPHRHEDDHVVGPALSRSERLIIRLQHAIRHNRDHAATYRSMAEEAREIGAEEAARWIRGAAEQSDRQTEDLERALTALSLP